MNSQWYQANPYQFHLLTLGTLHSLPTPVPRNNQKIVKPQFFEYLDKEKEAWEAVHSVRNWIIRRTTGQVGLCLSLKIGAFANGEMCRTGTFGGLVDGVRQRLP
jgi:hypothetical protein